MAITKVDDWGQWDLFDEFTIHEAAYLWAGYSPPEPGTRVINAVAVKKIMDLLLSKADKIVISKKGARTRVFEHHETKVSRETLLEIAEDLGTTPEFLYPDERTSFGPGKRRTYLRIIRGLLLLVDIQPKQGEFSKMNAPTLCKKLEAVDSDAPRVDSVKSVLTEIDQYLKPKPKKTK